MQIQVFTIPIFEGEEELNAMNKFLRSHRVAEIQKTFIPTASGGSWSFCITYLDSVKVVDPEIKKGKVDYRNVLNEKDFALFCEMRKVRKQIAEKEAIPPFAVFTDAELAEIAKLEKFTLSAMKSISGIGEKKIEKYGEYFLGIANETSRQFDEPNS
ncbi:MAG: HRDC domain-containing protein [Muribaculaceae bacterium]|nr:HRDC domain-containing protein [Muribaculaceae bacterium]